MQLNYLEYNKNATTTELLELLNTIIDYSKDNNYYSNELSCFYSLWVKHLNANTFKYDLGLTNRFKEFAAFHFTHSYCNCELSIGFNITELCARIDSKCIKFRKSHLLDIQDLLHCYPVAPIKSIDSSVYIKVKPFAIYLPTFNAKYELIDGNHRALTGNNSAINYIVFIIEEYLLQPSCFTNTTSCILYNMLSGFYRITSEDSFDVNTYLEDLRIFLNMHLPLF